MTPSVASTSVASGAPTSGPYAEQRVDDEGDVHAEHDEIAMREVDDVHHAPDQRQARGKQRVDGAQQKAADDHLDENKGHEPRIVARKRLHRTGKEGGMSPALINPYQPL